MHLYKLLNLVPWVAVVLLLQCSITRTERNSSFTSLEQAIEDKLEEERAHDGFQLSRKRRYLEFPEGSSFQLVYDLIVGIVDYTNYLILGVTVALAWELPSKPPSEILNDLTDRLKDGTLGTSRNDTISEIKYVDTKSHGAASSSTKYPNYLQPAFRPPMHSQYYVNRAPDSYYKARDYSKWEHMYSSKPFWPMKDSKYHYSPKPSHPFTKWSTSPSSYRNISPVPTKYPWWNLPTRLNGYAARPPIVKGSRRFDQGTTHFTNQKYTVGTGRSEHRVYPIFGKRSVAQSVSDTSATVVHRHHRRTTRSSDEFSKIDRIHIRHHRSTRHDLYERIETYLNGRGSHGHHCVLRALCETGQKSHEKLPGSFVGELMRAIFTLPEAFGGDRGYKEHRYDMANSHVGNCAARYQLCKDSMWSSHFVM
ncbi:uncharacterized protein LOC101901708 [Musca domestica]|uniref:Uncharacterized protein LOC101901708 n=1 Tax=Musca domestica TaxID=7370 RepID=A0A1I8NHV7_MUSDO|nr:uncharacterized protein LOC101901708 [Musca domestica]